MQLAPERRLMAAKYIAGGFLELMTTWLDRPSSVDTGALAGEFRSLTAGVLSAARRR
jgi:hypothetical protein